MHWAFSGVACTRHVAYRMKLGAEGGAGMKQLMWLLSEALLIVLVNSAGSTFMTDY